MAQSQDFARGLAAMTGAKRPGPDPDELEPQRDDDVPFERPDDQTETEPEPDAIAGRSTVSEEITRLRENLAAEGARREQMQREVEFLARASMTQQPQQPQPDPVREAMNMLRVDPQTWNRMLADPEFGGEQATNALQAVYQLGLHTARAENQGVVQQVAQHLQAQQQQNLIAREGEEMKRMFWERNQNLLPYERLVRQFASEVAGEVNQGRPYSSDQVLHEIGSRTRAELRSNYGVEIGEPAPGRRGRVSSMSDARDRMRPAAAEMGSGLGRRGAPLSPVQKSLYRLARRG